MDEQQKYRSPLVYQRADPFVCYHEGKYYFTASIPQYDCIELRCADTLNGLAFANGKIIWKKHFKGELSAHIWAPEIHFINGSWYIYFTGCSSSDVWSIRPYALVCNGDPMQDMWYEAGRVLVGHESFSLDMTSFIFRGKQYVAWAQTIEQYRGSEIFIASMKSPTELESKPVLLTSPEYPWEQQGFKVNEGPAFLHRNGKVFMTYSASDTGWRYCMGMIWADENSDLLDPRSWHKLPGPVFTTSFENGQFGPGHNCFTTDGDKDVLIYHCRNYQHIDGDPLYDPNRHAHAKLIEYDEDGFPVFGEPVPDNQL